MPVNDSELLKLARNMTIILSLRQRFPVTDKPRTTSTGKAERKCRGSINAFPNSWMHAGYWIMFSFSYLSEAKGLSPVMWSFVNFWERDLHIGEACPSYCSAFPEVNCWVLRYAHFSRCWMHLVSRNEESIFTCPFGMDSGVSFLRSSSVMDLSFFSFCQR